MKRCIPIIPLLALLLGGCTTVHVPQPLGDTPAPLDPEAWNGTWCDPVAVEMDPDTRAISWDADECLSLSVVDQEGGVADVVMLGGGREHYRAHLRHVGDERQRSVVTIESNDGYVLVGEIRHRPGLLLFWPVAADVVEGAVAGERMSGRVDREDNGRFSSVDVYVDPLGAGALAGVARDPRGILFERLDPTIAIRVEGP